MSSSSNSVPQRLLPMEPPSHHQQGNLPTGLPAAGLPWPEPIIVLPNLTIRPYHTTDGASLFRHANNPRIARNMPNTFAHPYTPIAASAFIARALAATRSHVKIWCISLTSASNAECIGGCTLEAGPDVFSRNAEIGFWIGEEFWGRGLGTVVCRALTNYAFSLTVEGQPVFQRVGAGVYGGTVRHPVTAGKVLRKCGFREEGRMRGMIWKCEEVRDLEIYGLMRGEWEGMKRSAQQSDSMEI
ncbi:hypothetical protein EG328_007095 [Venturia inaequalis]|uniref:N-acetyltransferase domain-containing protein n=1 Tax=Venturia inaequalis TaxID=5025 RepID=A0A8H3VBV3_VENIN|nr:hypothetical protein EG328_007095 [Venturia inaequalis]